MPPQADQSAPTHSARTNKSYPAPQQPNRILDGKPCHRRIVVPEGVLVQPTF